MAEMNDLASAFHKEVLTQTVLIRRAYQDATGVERNAHGTGVIVGHGKGTNPYIKIATAGHVIADVSSGQETWEIARLESDSSGKPFVVTQSFGKPNPANTNKVPAILRCEYLNPHDIGLVIVENKSDTPGRSFIDTTRFAPLKTSPRTGMPRMGARVAWAGFPGFVKDVIGSFNICYFEGVVSTTSTEPPLYLLDGHVAPGVSGGPLWLCDKEGRAVVIGVCVHYAGPSVTGIAMPGLAGFCPISVLLNHIEEVGARRQSTNDHDSTPDTPILPS